MAFYHNFVTTSRLLTLTVDDNYFVLCILYFFVGEGITIHIYLSQGKLSYCTSAIGTVLAYIIYNQVAQVYSLSLNAKLYPPVILILATQPLWPISGGNLLPDKLKRMQGLWEGKWYCVVYVVKVLVVDFMAFLKIFWVVP